MGAVAKFGIGHRWLGSEICSSFLIRRRAVAPVHRRVNWAWVYKHYDTAACRRITEILL